MRYAVLIYSDGAADPQMGTLEFDKLLAEHTSFGDEALAWAAKIPDLEHSSAEVRSVIPERRFLTRRVAEVARPAGSCTPPAR